MVSPLCVWFYDRVNDYHQQNTLLVFINANMLTLDINYLYYCGSVVEHYYKIPVQINCYKLHEYFVAHRINQTDVGVEKEVKTRNIV